MLMTKLLSVALWETCPSTFGTVSRFGAVPLGPLRTRPDHTPLFKILHDRIDIDGMGTRVADGLEQGFPQGLAHGVPQRLFAASPLKLSQIL
jgi:hypothetical protein